MTFTLTAGQVHETTALEDLLNKADLELLDVRNKQVAWPVALAGDKGYRADWTDKYLLTL